MPIFKLLTLTKVHSAVGAMSTIYGAYQATSLLKDVLAEVDEPEEFAAEVRELEAKHGRSFQGPEDSSQQIIKAVNTAANEKGNAQDALLRLISMVITKLGVAQGSRIVSLLLLACGVKPALTLTVLRLYVMLATTEHGQRILLDAKPKIAQAVAEYADPSKLADPLRQLASALGDKGADFVSDPAKASKAAFKKGRTAFGRLLDDLKQ